VNLVPEWNVPRAVRALITTRQGGVSAAPFDSLNLGAFCGDDMQAVRENRARLRQVLPSEPRWLRQVHGTGVVAAEESADTPPEADASYACHPDVVCAVLAADCLPVLLCNEGGSMVAAAHAGWRGLCAGVIEATVAQFSDPRTRLLAYLGPAISAQAYAVGEDVYAAFTSRYPADASAFRPAEGGKYWCDLYQLASARLRRAGISSIAGAGFCTYTDRSRFYSYRRDGRTGRFAALIWLAR
jgi:YfiH family protein